MNLSLVLLVAVLTAQAARADDLSTKPDFNRDIRPILANHCFTCHGPDASHRKGGLRLDARSEALKGGDSGPAFVPGRPDEGEALARIFSEDVDEVMPPPRAKQALTPGQKETLRRWVAEGAEYQEHWAYLAPRRPELPPVKFARWPRNEIDRFILARLEREGLTPSPRAEKTTLFRRVTLDLTGLPPTPGEVDDFLTDTSPEAYQKVVERLLGSAHYGERMAVDWLDAARFADSNGYQVDRDREMYAWRDWVVNAFNDNKPFDQFTVEQIAGDLLPRPTLEQRIATGFHRNHMMNEEGGVIAEEFLAEYSADRVETTAAVWLGQTFNCARCHDHKYDPFTQRDFYSLKAFFHNVTEKGLGAYGADIRRNNPPMLRLPAPEAEARLAALGGELAETRARLAGLTKQIAKGQAGWEQRLREVAVEWQAAELTRARVGDDEVPLDDSPGVRLPAPISGAGRVEVDVRLPVPGVSALRLEWSATDGKPAPRLSQVQVLRVDAGRPQPLRVLLVGADGTGAAAARAGKKARDGKPEDAPAADGRLLVTTFEFAGPIGSELLRLVVPLGPGQETGPGEITVSFTQTPGDLLAPEPLRAVAGKEPAERTEAETKQLADFHRSRHHEYRTLATQVATLAKQVDETELTIPTTLVMQEMAEPRPTHILVRGAYDKKGEEVAPTTPSALPPMAAGLPRNRLGLALWLTDPANPLTARVTVNRLWQSVFGTGLVRTAEDLGTRGEPPSHPELLDWLATEFVRTGWNVKAMMRLIVTSAAYQQSSRFTPGLRERDPENRLLARGPRFRLQAEFVRDQALTASGLLARRIGGPSVKPYHPPGLYEQIVAGKGPNTYKQGQGEDLYRRSLYTYWKRSVPNPAMLLFDAPFRENCALRRPRTNTPLQALNVMNDPTYVEAARRLAERMLREGGDTPEARVAYGFRLVTARLPRPGERDVLATAYERSLKDFRADQDGASALLKVGGSSADPTLDVAQVAALTTVASTLLNLDETLTKE